MLCWMWESAGRKTLFVRTCHTLGFSGSTLWLCRDLVGRARLHSETLLLPEGCAASPSSRFWSQAVARSPIPWLCLDGMAVPHSLAPQVLLLKNTGSVWALEAHDNHCSLGPCSRGWAGLQDAVCPKADLVTSQGAFQCLWGSSAQALQRMNVHAHSSSCMSLYMRYMLFVYINVSFVYTCLLHMQT